MVLAGPALGGCGQKGPLYLPPPAAPQSSAPAKPRPDDGGRKPAAAPQAP